MKSSTQDFTISRGQAFFASGKLWRVRKPIWSREVKVRLIRACIEPILFYGAQKWTLTATFTKRIDGCYTILLRKALGWTYRGRKTLAEICGCLEKPSQFLQRRRRRRRPLSPQPTSARGELCLWEASHKPLRKGKGRRLTYLMQLKNDIPDYKIEDVTTAAQNREV